MPSYSVPDRVQANGCDDHRALHHRRAPQGGDHMTTPNPAYDANAYLRALYGTDPFTMQIALCDPDGTVRRGMLHRGQDYPCTGSAHVMDEHVRCTSPAHAENVGHCGKLHPWGHSYCMPGCPTVPEPDPGASS